MASELKPWRYEIKYGPDGEDSYSWVYDDQGVMVAPMRTHKAKEVVDRMNTRPAPVDANLLASNPVDDNIASDANGNAPAATDTGLVTVAWQHQDYDEWHETRVPEYHKNRGKNVRELVTRSQAEELLAAERAEKEKERLRFEGDLDKWMKIIGAGITGYQPEAYALMDLACEELVKLRADNAALIHDLNRIKDHETELVNDNVAKDARIKELETELENGGRVKGVNTQYANALAYLEMTEDDDPEEFAKRTWDERKALEAKLAAAHEALEFYANTDNWKNGRFEQAEGGTVLQHYPSSAHKDRGATARAVLGGKP